MRLVPLSQHQFPWIDLVRSRSGVRHLDLTTGGLVGGRRCGGDGGHR